MRSRCDCGKLRNALMKAKLKNIKEIHDELREVILEFRSKELIRAKQERYRKRTTSKMITSENKDEAIPISVTEEVGESVELTVEKENEVQKDEELIEDEEHNEDEEADENATSLWETFTGFLGIS